MKKKDEKIEFADKCLKAFKFLEKLFVDPTEFRLFEELIIVNSTKFGKTLMSERNELKKKDMKK